MLWSSERQYYVWPFEKESELGTAVVDARVDLFGEARTYVDVQRTPELAEDADPSPTGYLIDLSSRSRPAFYTVNVALSSHDPLRRLAQQFLEACLSIRTRPRRVRATLRQAIEKSPAALVACEAYATENGLTGLDQLLDGLVTPDDFRALVIIDSRDHDIDHALRTSLKFPVEVLTLARFRSATDDHVVYEFEPFLQDLSLPPGGGEDATQPIDPAEADTLIVPAREEGFKELFLGEQMWRPVQIVETMLPKIRFVAGYQMAPIAAITHVAEVDRIEPWQGTSSYAVYFRGAPQTIGPIASGVSGKVPSLGRNRYTSFARLCRAHTLEDVL